MKKLLKLLLVLAGLLLIYMTLFSKTDISEIECSTSPYHNRIFLSGYPIEEIDGSLLQVIDKKNGNIIDSTIISTQQNRSSFEYRLGKPVQIDADWKIVFNGRSAKTSKYLHISDIDVEIVEERNMFQKVYLCRIYKWKVNGIQYSIDKGDHFVLLHKK